MILITLLTSALALVLGIISAFLYVTYQQEKRKSDGKASSTQYAPIDLPNTCDTDHSETDTDSDVGIPDIYTYLKKTSPSSGPSTQPSAITDALSNSKRRVVVSKEVDLAIEKLIEELMDYYIFSWYKPLVHCPLSSTTTSSNQASLAVDQMATQSVDQLRRVLKHDIWLLLSSFIDRLYSANYVHFLAISLVNRIVKHVQLLNRPKTAVPVALSATSSHETFQSYLYPTRNQPPSKSKRTSFSTQSSSNNCNASVSSASSSSSLSSSVSSTNLHATESAIPESIKVSSSTPDQVILFQLVSHLVNTSAEHNLLNKLAFFLLDVLLKETLEHQSILSKSKLFKLLLSDFLAATLAASINRLSDPTFLNYQIVRLIKNRIHIKHLIYVEPHSADSTTDSSRTSRLSSAFSIVDLKICLAEHNFNRLMEILDSCDDVDSLKTIRLHIIEEILDAAVVDYLNKQQQGEAHRGGNHGGGGSSSSKSMSPFNRKRSLDASLSARGKSNLLQQLRQTATGTLAFPGKGGDSEKEHGHTSEADMFDAIRRHFTFNANINSKVKVLQAKDLRRLVNKLRYAKTICEQKIQIHKRHSALLIPDTLDVPLDPSANSLEDSKFSFDISFNSELVRSFRRSSRAGTEVGLLSPDDETDNAGAGGLFTNLKPKKKHIFKFKVIMANDYCRQYFKRFLQQSLFNLQSGEFHRSSRNKFRKDILICECCAYLVEVWETIQQVFSRFYHFYNARTSAHSHRHNRQFADSLHSLFSHCYLLVLQTVSDSRFYYTFSDRFLQLPSELLKALEAFLLGDVELSMLKRTFDDFSIERFATRLDFSPEDHQQMANNCLSRIDLPKYLNVFLLLERIIFKCLCDEFYPQFLISTEYDEMLHEQKSTSSIDVDRETASTLWCGLKFANFDSPDQVLNKQFATMLATNPKAIHKVLLDGDQVDIVKNRSILLNCLEFPFFCLTSTQFIVQHRLSLKIYMKDFIAQVISGNTTELVPLFLEVAQLLSRDIVYYLEMYSHLHSIIGASYCWLHSDFSCNITDIQVQPVLRASTASIEGKIISFVENIFSDGSSSTSGASSTSQSSNPLLEHNYRLTFRICTTAIPSRLEHLPAFIRSQLQSTFSPFWSLTNSFDGLLGLITKWTSPNLRMMTFLCRTGLHDYIHNLGNMMEPKHALLQATSSSLPTLPITEEAQQQQKQLYWEKLIRHLANDQLSIKRLFRHEVREQMKRERLKVKPGYSERLSFKKLLDKESAIGETSFDQQHSLRSNSISAPQNVETSANLIQISHMLNQLFSRLTADRDLTKTTGFLNLVQYECGQTISQPINDTTESTHLCLRCQLVEHLIEGNMDDLNGFYLQSLCLLAFKSGLEPRTLVSPTAHQEAVNADSKERGSGKTKLMEALQLPQQATRLFLQSTSSLPKVQGFNQSGQLLFLHARSLLTERSSSEILDFTLSSFRHFDRFCPSCTEKMHQDSIKSTGGSGDLRTMLSHGHRKRAAKIKFRLFNIEPTCSQRQQRGGTSGGGGSEVALDVVASLTNGSLTDVSSMTSSSMLHENVGSAFFDDDSLGSMEPFALGLGSEDLESNLIEPLFQLLVEVFELKGTMIRTFRRTLIFGFRLVFGPTMLSKQIKASLQHLFTDANILQLIGVLQETVQGWNDELEKANANSDGAVKGSATTTSSSSEQINLSDLNKLLDAFPTLVDTSLSGIPESDSRPGSAQSTTSSAAPVASGPDDVNRMQVPNDNETGQSNESPQQTEDQAANIARLRILAKQLLFASMPTFLNHLFGAENTITGLSKSFDILQYQTLNKQLIYEFLEAFLLEYYPEFKKI